MPTTSEHSFVPPSERKLKGFFTPDGKPVSAKEAVPEAEKQDSGRRKAMIFEAPKDIEIPPKDQVN